MRPATSIVGGIFLKKLISTIPMKETEDIITCTEGLVPPIVNFSEQGISYWKIKSSHRKSVLQSRD